VSSALCHWPRSASQLLRACACLLWERNLYGVKKSTAGCSAHATHALPSLPLAHATHARTLPRESHLLTSALPPSPSLFRLPPDRGQAGNQDRHGAVRAHPSPSIHPSIHPSAHKHRACVNHPWALHGLQTCRRRALSADTSADIEQADRKARLIIRFIRPNCNYACPKTLFTLSTSLFQLHLSVHKDFAHTTQPCQRVNTHTRVQNKQTNNTGTGRHKQARKSCCKWCTRFRPALGAIKHPQAST